MEISVILLSITTTMILIFSSLLGSAQSRILVPRVVENEAIMVNRPALSPPPSPPPRQAMNPFLWYATTDEFYKFTAFVFRSTNVVLPKSLRNLFVFADNNGGCCGRSDPPKPPSPDPNPPDRQIDGDQNVAATGGYMTPASRSLSWPLPLIFPPTIIDSNNWYGRESPKSPPPPTANTPGRQIDGDQYVAATGGYMRPPSAGPPSPSYPLVE
nr:uncharacterized protein LOC109155293 [Ipomoea batatas]GME11915.1 uncharacterized protein LOC109155293 [Ipomoea batatas]